MSGWTTSYDAFPLTAAARAALKPGRNLLAIRCRQNFGAQQVDPNNPLPEYPRPDLVRTNWLNLNGIWQFQAGNTNDPVPTNQVLSGEILVPFPMESAISGVMQYHARSWYRRTFSVPAAW